MIQQLKLGFKLLPLAYRFKSTMAGLIIFTILGFIMKIRFSENPSFMGDVFVLMPGIWLSQLFFGLDTSGLVQVSTKKKALQTSIPVLCAFVTTLAAYILLTVIEIIQLQYHFISEEWMVYNRISDGAFCFLILIYIGICYKYFISSTIIMFIGLEVLIFLGNMAIHFTSFFDGIPVALGILIGFFSICISSALQYGISLLTYKKPLSKLAQYQQLRNYM